MTLDPADITIEEVHAIEAQCIVADLCLPSSKSSGDADETRAHAQPEVRRLVVDLEAEDCYGLDDKKIVQNSRVIAVDFVSLTFALTKYWSSTMLTMSNTDVSPPQDDVLAQSCAALTKAHNEHYGTNLTLDDFESYYPHRNRGR
jgi:hypothetical protein